MVCFLGVVNCTLSVLARYFDSRHFVCRMLYWLVTCPSELLPIVRLRLKSA